jgi:hypothetical protein
MALERMRKLCERIGAGEGSGNEPHGALPPVEPHATRRRNRLHGELPVREPRKEIRDLKRGLEEKSLELDLSKVSIKRRFQDRVSACCAEGEFEDAESL